MEEPLFDGEKRSMRLFEYGTAGALILFVGFSVIACMALGAMHKLYEHFVFAVLLLLTFGILVILVMWYKQGDLDPKFKYLMGFTALVVVFTGIAANVYIWQPLPVYPSQTCWNQFKNDSYYNWGTQKCLQISGMDNCLQMKKGYCIKMSSATQGSCFNCTLPPGPPHVQEAGVQQDGTQQATTTTEVTATTTEATATTTEAQTTQTTTETTETTQTTAPEKASSDASTAGAQTESPN